jgi:hypothetical protein
MSYGLSGPRRRPWLRRRTGLDWSVEPLEGRRLLSHGASPKAPPTSAEVTNLAAQQATTTVLQASTKATASGPRVSLVATVRAPGPFGVVTAGSVRFSIASPSPEHLGRSPLNRLGRANLTTSRLNVGGTYAVQAQFIPSVRGYTSSFAQLTLSVTPPVVTSFRITARHYFGAPGTPLTFTVTALDVQKQPVTNYTGTIDLFSPTDHAAKLSPRVYTFTTADQGAHTFVDGITFHKGGAEILKVDQKSNTKIDGRATFGIE